MSFKVGAAVVNAAPSKHAPTIVNGMLTERSATALRPGDTLSVRSLVLSDHTTRLAIVVVDSCMLPVDLIDKAKARVHTWTGIPTEHIIVSATHTHYAPSAMGLLGSRADMAYRALLIHKIATSVAQAHASSRAAEFGWAVVPHVMHNHCRRWIVSAGCAAHPTNCTICPPLPPVPTGGRHDRAQMIIGERTKCHVGPAGPSDHELSLLAFRALDGTPIAVYANYANHYVTSYPLSSDYFGRFAQHVARRIHKNVTVVMSQGASGDTGPHDFSGRYHESARARWYQRLDAYSDAMAVIAVDAYKTIKFSRSVPLAMAEARLLLQRRIPTLALERWAVTLTADMKHTRSLRKDWSADMIYAQEQFFLRDEPNRSLRLQAIRIGDVGICATPNEIYGITGIKLKLQSPLQPTIVVGLANGAEGYVPPPEQHALGGYSTWPARHASLDIYAEPAIVNRLLVLLQEVSGELPRPFVDPGGLYVRSVLASNPTGFWRLGEIEGDQATNAIDSQQHGTYELGVAFFLPGCHASGMAAGRYGNRAAHFAGGRARLPFPSIKEHSYSFECWIWNGLTGEPVTPAAAQRVVFFALQLSAGNQLIQTDILGLVNSNASDWHLFLEAGNAAAIGSVLVPPYTWSHIVLTCDHGMSRVLVNASRDSVLDGHNCAGQAQLQSVSSTTAYVGGPAEIGQGRLQGFEGRLDEVAIYTRPLNTSEVIAHLLASDVCGSPIACSINAPRRAEAPEAEQRILGDQTRVAKRGVARRG